MEHINVAFVGLRHGHAFSLYEALLQQEGITVLGAFEEDENARSEAEKRGIICNYSTLAQVLTDARVDVVCVGDTYAKRGALCLQILQAGKHALSDKPLCTDIKMIPALRDEAKKQGKALGMCLSLRCNPAIATALDLVKKGTVGEVNNIIFEGEHPLNYGTRPDWYFDGKSHGGVITDIAVHGIDLARQFTGSNLKTVHGARCWNFYADKAPRFQDSAQLMIETENGAGVIGDVSYAAPTPHGFTHPSYWHLRVFGKKGMLDFRCTENKVTLYSAENADAVVISAEPQAAQEYTQFFDCLRNPEKIPAYNQDILNVMEQTLRIQQYADRKE